MLPLVSRRREAASKTWALHYTTGIFTATATRETGCISSSWPENCKTRHSQTTRLEIWLVTRLAKPQYSSTVHGLDSCKFLKAGWPARYAATSTFLRIPAAPPAARDGKLQQPRQHRRAPLQTRPRPSAGPCSCFADVDSLTL